MRYTNLRLLTYLLTYMTRRLLQTWDPIFEKSQGGHKIVITSS